MFVKVYQYPPRRGNGSYWTLLSEGEEELKRAVPLFSTFRPPVIDSECVYSRGAAPATYTVKSKGQFVPLLPRNCLTTTNQAYFSIDGTLSTGARVQPGGAVTEDIVLDSARLESVAVDGNHWVQSKNLPAHMLEHSYARLSHIQADDLIYSSSESDKENEGCPPTPKRKKASVRKPSTSSRLPASKSSSVNKGQKQGWFPSETSEAPDDDGDDRSFQTPPKEKDSSLHLLDSSFLTPLRNLDPVIEIGPISLSPLYTNFVTPERDTAPSTGSSATQPALNATSPLAITHRHAPTASVSSAVGAPIPCSSSALPLPELTPLCNFTGVVGGVVGSFDSGIFSPLSSDPFNVKFSTPVLSPFTAELDLLQPNTFSTPHPPDFLTPLRVLDSSNNGEATPLRVGSLGALGLPGFTPPAAPSKSRR